MRKERKSSGAWTTWIVVIAAVGWLGVGRIPSARAEIVSEAVEIETRDAKVTLAGTLSRPRGDGPFPGVVLVTGSGDHVRDQTISGAPMFRWIAERLSAEGFAVLRVDERGAGGSGGVAYPQQDTTSRVGDVRACLGFLRSHARVDADRVGLLGHSEGSMIAARLSAMDGKVAFMVLLAAPALPGREIFLLQRTQPGDETDRDSIRRRRVAMAALIDVGHTESSENDWRDAVRRQMEAEGATDEQIEERLDDETTFISRFHTTPWYRGFLSSDVRQYLRGVQAPTLALYGAADRQTPPSLHAPELIAALLEAPVEDFAVVVLPDQDHFFLRQHGRSANEHAWSKMHLSDEMLDVVARWLRSRFVTGSAYENSEREGNPKR